MILDLSRNKAAIKSIRIRNGMHDTYILSTENKRCSLATERLIDTIKYYGDRLQSLNLFKEVARKYGIVNLDHIDSIYRLSGGKPYTTTYIIMKPKNDEIIIEAIRGVVLN